MDLAQGRIQQHLAVLGREDGQGLTEYALIIALIAVVAIAALSFLGGNVSDALTTLANSI